MEKIGNFEKFFRLTLLFRGIFARKYRIARWNTEYSVPFVPNRTGNNGFGKEKRLVIAEQIEAAGFQ